MTAWRRSNIPSSIRRNREIVEREGFYRSDESGFFRMTQKYLRRSGKSFLECHI